ncbi:MAG: hypothetical protein R6W06_08295 [Prochlorococcaceae cyanobacterium]
MKQPSDPLPPLQPLRPAFQAGAAGHLPLPGMPAAVPTGAETARIPEANRISEAARIRALEEELASTRAELEQLQQLLAELPGIFERKFQQRLEPVLQQQHQLLEENTGLREQMRQLPAAAAAPAPLVPAWAIRNEPGLLMPSLPPRLPIRLARPRRGSSPEADPGPRNNQTNNQSNNQRGGA